MVLLVPTMLMGATLPLVVRSTVVSRGVLGPRVGLLYAINAGGAITGAILAGFYLIGQVGLTRTFVVAAAINVCVGVGAWLLPVRPRGTEGSTGAGGRVAIGPRPRRRSGRCPIASA